MSPRYEQKHLLYYRSNCGCRDRAQTSRSILINLAGQCAAPRIGIDAHRDDGKRFVVLADEKLTSFVELGSEASARCGDSLHWSVANPADYGLSFPITALVAPQTSRGRGWFSMGMRSGSSPVTWRVVVVATLVGSAAQPTSPMNATISRQEVPFMFPLRADSECTFQALGRQEMATVSLRASETHAPKCNLTTEMRAAPPKGYYCTNSLP
jgi:hypothetical protein